MARYPTARRAALRGAAAAATVVGVTAVPMAGGTAALAGTGQAAYDCVIFSTHFDYTPTITVTAPANAGVGGAVAFEAAFDPMPNKAPLPVDRWTTTGTMALSGAQTGQADMSAPQKTGPIAPGTPIPVGTLNGTFTAANAGDVALAPGTIVVNAVASGANAAITCTLKSPAPTLATVKVGAAGPAASVTPGTVVQGGAVSVSGTGWQSGAAELALCDANGASCQAGDLTDVTASADGAGKLTASAKVAAGAAPGARKLRISQGEVSVTLALTVTEKTPPPTGSCADKPDGRCGEQKVTLTVGAGPLTMAQRPGEVTLTPVTLDGTEKSATGDLRQVQVVDARGGTTGWTLTGTLTDFVSAGGPKIPAGNLTWTPKCTAGAGASPVTTGSAGPLDTTTAATLCGAADGSGSVVGGTFTADAGLDLKVPPVTGAGDYTAILTLTLS